MILTFPPQYSRRSNIVQERSYVRSWYPKRTLAGGRSPVDPVSPDYAGILGQSNLNCVATAGAKAAPYLWPGGLDPALRDILVQLHQQSMSRSFGEMHLCQMRHTSRDGQFQIDKKNAMFLKADLENEIAGCRRSRFAGLVGITLTST